MEQRKNERAAMCANELAEVRKLIKLLSETQIAIERIMLRLETIKELSCIMIDLKPALETLKGVTTTLVDVMPDVASELGKVNDSIQETLAVARFSTEPSQVIDATRKTAEGQEILKEVNSLLTQKIAENLPEPPTSEKLNTARQPAKQTKEMVALVAGVPESSSIKQEATKTFFSIEDLKMQSISLKIESSESLEKELLEYITECEGKIDVAECAFELNVSPETVKKMLEKLDTQGRIIMHARSRNVKA